MKKTTRRQFIQQSTLTALAAAGAGSGFFSLIGVGSAQGVTKNAPPVADVPGPDFAVNAVPYISTYYIQPKVKMGESAVINYYVTDATQKEYMQDDYSETFTIDYWVNGERSTLRDVKAGDNSITLKPLPRGNVLFAFQATDKAGRKSHRLFQEFRVIDPREEAIPADKVLTPDLKRFNIYNDDTHPVETTKGLTEMLKWASENGYRKVVLPKGRYRLDENMPVTMATNLTLDMNGSTFKLNPNALGSALMMQIVNCVDSHVINGTFEGDMKEHDYKNAPNGSEWVNGFALGFGAQYCSFEDVKLIDITGYGSNTTMSEIGEDGKVKGGYSLVNQGLKKFVPGDINDKGELVASTVRVSSSDFTDISKFKEVGGFLQMGLYLGYQGNPTGSWVYKAHFYDADQKYLETIEGYMYRRLYIPESARFVKMTVFSSPQRDLASEEDLKRIGSLTLFRFNQPYNCAFKNIHHENNRVCGMVPSGFYNLLVEGCTFENCGEKLTRCAFDAEDGWDMMQDLTFRNNIFGKNPNNEFLTAGGDNFVMENNVMIAGMWDRTRGSVYRNNTLKNNSWFAYGTSTRSGYSRIYNNTFQGAVRMTTATATPDREYYIRDCTIPGSVVSNVSAKEGKLVAASFYKCKIGGGKFNAKATQCQISDIKNAGGTFEIYDSTIKNSDLFCSGYGSQSKISGSALKSSKLRTQGSTLTLENNTLSDTICIAGGDWSNGHEWILRNNKIDTPQETLVDIGNNFKRVLLERNTITSSNPKFTAVLLRNPNHSAKDTASPLEVALIENTFEGQGRTAVHANILPGKDIALALILSGNKYNGLEEVSPNMTGVPNVKITRGKHAA